jgi:hypothetical protein
LNFTLALLGGLVLIFPGLAVIAAWHLQSGQNGVRRADIPLTSIVTLVMVVGVSLLAHGFGWAMTEAAISSARELKPLFKPMTNAWGLSENPYETAARLAEGVKTVPIGPIIGFAAIVALEAVVFVSIASSPGLGLTLHRFDIGNQGWVFQNIILPTRHGMKPIAFVLTNAQNGPAGLGYRGVIVEARQSSDGELKGLTLANPDAFIYAVNLPGADAQQQEPRLSVSGRRPLEGTLTLEAAVIRNVLVQAVPDAVVDEIVATVAIDEAQAIGEAGP